MIARHMGARRGVPSVRTCHALAFEKSGDGLVVLAVLANKRIYGERAHVEFVEAGLHRRDIDLVRGIRQVPRRTGEASRHLRGRDDAHFALRVDDIRANQQLVRLAMDEAVCGSAAN